MPTDIIPTLAGVVNDTLSAYAVPFAGTGAGIFQTATGRLLEGRLRKAGEVLLQEVRLGHATLSAAEMEAAVAVVFRFSRAAVEGAGRNNLRLMARMIDGLMAEKALYSDDFLRDADTVASLTYEEIAILAAVCRALPEASDQDPSRVELFFRAGMSLVPGLFPDEASFRGACAPLFRTGYVNPMPTGFSGNISYAIMPALERLARLARFQETDIGRPGTGR